MATRRKKISPAADNPSAKTGNRKTSSKKISYPPADPTAAYGTLIKHYAAENRLRHIPTASEDSASGRSLIDLLSNDYLGLGADSEKYIAEFRSRFPDADFSSSASRLLSRKNKYHNQLEDRLAELYSKPALLFNSGYHANVGIIQALALPHTMFIADKLVHASAIDGLRLSEADFKRFPHNIPERAERILKDKYDDYDRFIIIVESIYSMDGDLAPLRKLVALKKKYPKVMLYVDEAHAFGVRGPKGLGLAEEYNLIQDIDIIIGTLGKAAASAGAFAICAPILKDYLINSARSFIFSTAISPAQAAWSILMLEKIIQSADRRRHLRHLSQSLIRQLDQEANIETPSSSQIIPIIIGDAGEAINMSRYLRENGFDSLAIRKPTVAAGSERVRLSLNALLSQKDISRLVTLIREYK